MTFAEIILSQLVDPFRIGLVVALVATAERTRATTGMALPLAAGVAFIAVMIPVTMQQSSADPLLTRILAGVVSTGVLLAVALAGLLVWRRTRSS
jgi:hypothetical protein